MRHINRIVIHCTATKNGKHVTVEDVRSWHKERGFKDIGYHYLIYADGSVHQGRKESSVGAHASGYNANSIGVCMVGGVGRTHKYDTGSYTKSQWDSLKSLIEDLVDRYPGSTVCGHRDLSPDEDGDGIVEPEEWIKLCPAFDVGCWLEAGMSPPEGQVL